MCRHPIVSPPLFPRHRPLFVPIAINSRRRGIIPVWGRSRGRSLCHWCVCSTRHRPRVPHRPPEEPVDWIPVMCDCALCPCYSSMETPPAPWSVRSYDLSNIIPRAWLINGGSRPIYGLGRREMHRGIHSSDINLLAVKLWNQSRTRYRGMKLARLVLRVLQTSGRLLLVLSYKTWNTLVPKLAVRVLNSAPSRMLILA